MTAVDQDHDAFGHLLNDYFEMAPAHEIIERDDGFIFSAPMPWFLPIEHWLDVERRALTSTRGRTLDIGTGAGRVALELQRRGHEVVAIDVSPLAVSVAQRMGVRDARVLALDEVDERLGVFDTIVLFGNNFGLFETETGARDRLRHLRAVAAPQATLLATTTDPTQAGDPVDIAYQQRNRKQGRLPGQLTLRVRYKQYASPWFDYLEVSPEEMRALVEGTGWIVDSFIQDESPYYVGVLREESAPRPGE